MALVRQGENDHIEFKRKVAHPEKIVREVAAFANSDGGHLLIGVSDNGDVPGLKFPEEEEYVMTKAIQELIKPRVQYKLEYIPIAENDDKAVLHYEIYRGKKKPYFAREKVGEKLGIAYVRVADRSIKASKELKEILRLEKQNRGTAFQYGQEEQMLMEYLEANGEVTLEDFKDLASIPLKAASKKLVLLVSANVLNIIPQEKRDVYTIKTTSMNY